MTLCITAEIESVIDSIGKCREAGRTQPGYFEKGKKNFDRPRQPYRPCRFGKFDSSKGFEDENESERSAAITVATQAVRRLKAMENPPLSGFTAG
jgi:hypothetical protein